MLFRPGEITKGSLHCKILRPVSKGKMSEVYLAELLGTEHKLMVKVTGKSSVGYGHLKKEAALMSTLRFDGIPEMYEWVDEGSRGYYIMSYHEGMTLVQYQKRYGQVSQKTVKRTAKSICRILTYLHTRDEPIIHSDIKPANILLHKSEVILLDFGVAQAMDGHCKNTFFQGTMGYAAPECWQKDFQICPATDLFALGVTMYYLLEGKEPSRSFGKYELTEDESNKKNRWQPVLDRCTALDREDRYQNAAQLYKDLDKIIC